MSDTEKEINNVKELKANTTNRPQSADSNCTIPRRYVKRI
jgi:hypothetical protein